MASITPVTVGEKRGISSLLDESVVSDSSCNSLTDGDLLCDESEEEIAVPTGSSFTHSRRKSKGTL